MSRGLAKTLLGVARGLSVLVPIPAPLKDVALDFIDAIIEGDEQASKRAYIRGILEAERVGLKKVRGG